MQALRIFKVVFLTTLVGVATRYIGFSQESELVVRPFSATTTITTFSATGDYYGTKVQSYAIRADGSHSLSMTQVDPAGAPKTHKTVYDVPGSVRITADDLTETTIVFPMKNLARSLGHRSEECLGKPLGDERIMGYQVVRTEEIVDVPSDAGGRLKTVRYQAPELNCYTVKEEAYRSRGDGPLVRLEVKEVVAVTEGEPDVSAFALPEGYTERTPTEMLREFGRRYPDSAMSEERLQKLKSIDEAHRAANSRR